MKFNRYCYKDKTKLPECRFFLSYLQILMTIINAPDYRNFKQNIRLYNRTTSFVSMGTKLASNVPSCGPYCFKGQNQIYHRTAYLHPLESL